MKALWKFGVVAFLVGSGALLWLKWKHDEPRRDCIQSLQAFCQLLNSGDSHGLLQSVILPQALINRTPTEQTEFLQKALRDEISLAGIDALRRAGLFGRLKEVFPTEAEGWAARVGVNPEDCLAFRMEHGGTRAEVVVLHEGQSFRILRCNNVRQMALAEKKSS